MSVLADYDMVLALSIEQINEQFRQLCNEGILDKSWETQLSDDGSELDAKIKEFKLSALKDENRRVLFTISFESGKLRYWKGRGPKSTKEELDMQGCEYAFAIKVAQLECKVEKISEEFFITKKANEAMIKIIEGSSIPAKFFTVESLFLDFQNANVAEFDTTKSILKFKDDPDALETFQSLITGYLRKFRGSKNPYILGYNLKLLPNLSPISEAIFKPTYCTFSISYHDKKELQALNFLMMTENQKKPSEQSAGILDKSLITNQNIHGNFAISFKLFESKILTEIIDNFKESYKRAIEVLKEGKKPDFKKEDGNFFVGKKVKASLKKTTSFELTRVDNKEGYKWETKSPYIFELDAEEHEESWGRKDDNTYNEKTLMYSSIELINHQTKLELFVNLEIKVEQTSKKCGGYFNDPNDYYKCDEKTGEVDNFNSPASISIYIEAGTKGELTISYTVNEGKLNYDKSIQYREIDGSLREFFSSFHNSLNGIAGSMKKDLESKIGNYFAAKIILPLGNLYTFKNIRLHKKSDKSDIEGDAVICDITYAPIYSPVEK